MTDKPDLTFEVQPNDCILILRPFKNENGESRMATLGGIMEETEGVDERTAVYLLCVLKGLMNVLDEEGADTIAQQGQAAVIERMDEDEDDGFEDTIGKVLGSA